MLFLVLLTKESPNLSALKQKFLDEIKQSDGIKLPKSQIIKLVCKFLPHNGNLCW